MSSELCLETNRKKPKEKGAIDLEKHILGVFSGHFAFIFLGTHICEETL